MSYKVNPSGLLGLVMKIDEELRSGKSIDEILSKYPVGKTVLPYLLTLVQECSDVLVDIVKDYGKLESDYKRLESELERLNSKDTIKELLSLRERVRELEKQIEDLQDENTQLKDELMLFNRFIDESFFGALLYKRFLNAL